MSAEVFTDLVDQDAAIAEFLRAAHAARLRSAQQHTNPLRESRLHQASADAPAKAPAKPQSTLSVDAATAAGAAVNLAAMSHAWLITGPPGSGRSLAARAFAAALECTDPDTPGCGKCNSCKAVMAGNHPDVEIKSTNAVTISAKEVRDLVAQAYLSPASGSWRIFIIEDADRMLTNTTNVLLKAIEEPANQTVWMLCTTAPADVLPTIRSRCRNINLATPSPKAVAQLLAQRDGIDFETALVAAQAAQSHIGVARALLHDESAKALRFRTLSALASIRGIGDAVITAKAFTDANYMLAQAESAAAAATDTNTSTTALAKQGRKKSSHEASEEAAVAAARIAKMEALGLDPNGKIPAAVRAQISNAAEDEKRRKTRLQHDMIDRELTYLLSYFRDVLMIQLGASAMLINPDFQDSIAKRANATKSTQTLKVLDAIATARERLTSYVNPLLLLESALIESYLATQPE
ncbi:DNA polymerase III subunit delta' [Arcanobacterium hippocoleae]|uniref:DNA polymerase III subunit delta' n=1 Tax=Arcanobacterium hippocoleae TaxID=149017 RepID=UPI00333E57DF